MAIEKVIDIKIQGNTDQAIGTLRQQLKAAVADVQNLSEAYGENSRQAIEAAQKAASIKDRIEDANDAILAFKGEGTFLATSKALTSVASGFTAVQGAMGLMGAQGEEVEQALLKVQSAMALSQGLAGLEDAGRSFKQLGAVIKETNIVKLAFNFIQTGQIGLTRASTIAKTEETAATVASTAATSGATLGLKLFRLAIIGTGVGALVVGLIALYQNFDKVKAAVYNLLPGLADIGEFVGNVITSVTDFVGATSDASRALDKLKSDADATLALNKRFMQEHGDQVDQYTAKKIAAKNAYLEAIKEDGANVAALGQRLNRELAAIDKEREDKRKEARDKIKKEEDAAAKKAKDERDAAAKKEADDRDALASKLGQDAEARYDAILKIESDARKANAEALLTDQELAIQRENEAYQIKYDNAKAAGISTEELEIEHLNRLNNIKLAAQEKDYQQMEDFAKKEQDLDIAIKDAKRAALDTALNILMQFAGKNKTIALSIIAIQKGLAIADVIVGASKSIAAATASAAPTPLNPPFLGPGVPNPSFAINAKLAAKSILLTKLTAGTSIASILAAGIGQATSITSGGGGASGGDSGGGGGASGANAPQFNVVGSTGVNQLAGAIGNREAAPVQAYVISQNVTTAQSLQRNIIESATLGG
jgi:hypothetical protein